MKRTEEQLDAKQILSVIEKYNLALDLLDAYDHQNMKRPEGGNTIYILSYEECRKVIDSMSYGEYSNVFGNEKDDSFKGSIGAIYQTFAGQEVYPSLEEKAANLLYFITKNHSFSDVHALFVARKKSFRLCIRFSLIQGQKLLKFYFCGTTLIADFDRPLNCVLTYTSPW